ncbi:hypothetical protein SFRURICE_013044, partial [Spodoptera frugiperda]
LPKTNFYFNVRLVYYFKILDMYFLFSKNSFENIDFKYRVKSLLDRATLAYACQNNINGLMQCDFKTAKFIHALGNSPHDQDLLNFAIQVSARYRYCQAKNVLITLMLQALHTTLVLHQSVPDNGSLHS